MKKIGSIIALLLSCSSAFSQMKDHGKVWVQGGPINFTSVFTGASVQNAYLDTLKSIFFAHGSSNVCDSAGNLILCCNGFNIYDSDLQIIEDGADIAPAEVIAMEQGWSSYSQTSIFLPVGNGKYYLFTATASDHEVNTYWKDPSLGRALYDLLYCHTIDMNANNGVGKVTERMKPLLENVKLSKTQMMACRHGDGKSWWLFKQAHDTNMVYKFLVTSEKVHGPYIQGFAEPHFSKWDQNGQAMFSADGTKYATTIRGSKKIFVADFDRCSGMLSNPKVYQMPYHTVVNPYDNSQIVDSFSEGLCFSPNGRFIYVAGYYHIQQLDLQDGNPATAWYKVAQMDTTWDFFQSYSSIYPGPNGKLYIGNWSGMSSQMSAIDNPDVKGPGCNFCARCLRFPKYMVSPVFDGLGVSQPPCMPNYKLGATNPPCTVGVEETSEDALLSVYPNPARTTITVAHKEEGRLYIYDMQGAVCKDMSLNRGAAQVTIDVRSMTPGIYSYRFITSREEIRTGKLAIIQ